MLITAGPTHEPIDAVRFIGNRSSGRMGIALAAAAASVGWDVTLLLGPACERPADYAKQTVIRFRSCADLEALLTEHAAEADVIIMAAAVADYRPKPNPALLGSKLRRVDSALSIELEPTPDLLAQAARTRSPGQFYVGFALEPRADLRASAAAKLQRKDLDLVVANPLETMDSPNIEASLLTRAGRWIDTPGVVSKGEFASWFLDQLDPIVRAHRLCLTAATAV